MDDETRVPFLEFPIDPPYFKNAILHGHLRHMADA
jgi:hypothetical protein